MGKTQKNQNVDKHVPNYHKCGRLLGLIYSRQQLRISNTTATSGIPYYRGNLIRRANLLLKHKWFLLLDFEPKSSTKCHQWTNRSSQQMCVNLYILPFSSGTGTFIHHTHTQPLIHLIVFRFATKGHIMRVAFLPLILGHLIVSHSPDYWHTLHTSHRPQSYCYPQEYNHYHGLNRCDRPTSRTL